MQPAYPDTLPTARHIPVSLQRALLHAGMIGVFSERARLHAGIDLKLFYLVILLCLPPLLWVWDFALPRPYLLGLAALWSMGLLSLLTAGNQAQGLFTEGLGITLCSLFYLLLLRSQGSSLEEIFALYASFAYWVSLLGFPIAAIETLQHGELQPVRSILLEPAHLCQIVLPAFFFYASTSVTNAKHRRRMLVILAAILCSVSSTGVVALLLAALLLMRGHKRGLLLIPALVIPLFALLYITSDHLRLRVEDSVNALTHGDITGANLSTYTLLSNVYVTQRALSDYPLLGAGLGSYEHLHAHYIGALPGGDSFIGTFNFDGNAKDANSLLLRLSAEFGYTGLLGLALLLYRYRASTAPTYAAISHAAMLYFFMKLFREGHYFSPEMYFFVWAYVLASKRLRDRPTAMLYPQLAGATA